MNFLKLVIVAVVCRFAAGQEKVCSAFCTALGTLQTSPGRSCNDIYQINKNSRGVSGSYWIDTTTGVHQVYCDMELECGGHKGGWMRIADIDTTRGDTCPSGWGFIIMEPFRACRSASDDAGCHSTSFSVSGVSYHKVCGKARGYQKDSTDAFGGPRRQRGSQYVKDINGAYVDGLSITTVSPRKHVWTYSSGNNDDNSAFVNINITTDEHTCPCAAVPGLLPFPFIHDDYYCESGSDGGSQVNGIYTADALWDGSGCDGMGDNCCTESGRPWFYQRFSTAQQSDVEARICADEDWGNEGVVVDQLQLFVM